MPWATRFDRLTRNLSALCKLRDNGIRFVAVDNSDATELTVKILISVAQEEARLISERTKRAITREACLIIITTAGTTRIVTDW